MGCQTTNIPDVKFYAEIPFQDCPEAVYVTSVTKKRGIVSCEQWKEMRPYMLMIDPEGKKDIFMQWAEACRWAGVNQQQCNVKLKSTREVIEAVDKVTEKFMGGLPK